MVYHALGLSMHQPLGNLLGLHNSEESWEAKQILWAYDRPTRAIEGYEDVAKLHISFSGTLLKQFEDPAIRETFHDVIDIEDMLRRYRKSNIEFLGTGLYHPIYPLTPKEDWDAHTAWWIGLGRALLGRKDFNGFYPPEMGFCMEMIPMLKKYGYKYVIVDCWYIKPKREMRWEELRYRPYRACYDNEEIIVVPCDRGLSNAQASGLDPGWFKYEVAQRTKWCDFPALVTTWSDGENGGWFRNTNVEANFWGHFYRPILDDYKAGKLGFTPIHISDYLKKFAPKEEVEVYPGAWNTGEHWGGDFTQWTGSLLQKRGWDEIRNASAYYHRVKMTFEQSRKEIRDPEDVKNLIINAYDHLLMAETSCNFYWGSRWVYRAFDEIEKAYRLLDQAISQIPKK